MSNFCPTPEPKGATYTPKDRIARGAGIDLEDLQLIYMMATQVDNEGGVHQTTGQYNYLSQKWIQIKRRILIDVN